MELLVHGGALGQNSSYSHIWGIHLNNKLGWIYLTSSRWLPEIKRLYQDVSVTLPMRWPSKAWASKGIFKGTVVMPSWWARAESIKYSISDRADRDWLCQCRETWNSGRRTDRWALVWLTSARTSENCGVIILFSLLCSRMRLSMQNARSMKQLIFYSLRKCVPKRMVPGTLTQTGWSKTFPQKNNWRLEQIGVR